MRNTHRGQRLRNRAASLSSLHKFVVLKNLRYKKTINLHYASFWTNQKDICRSTTSHKFFNIFKVAQKFIFFKLHINSSFAFEKWCSLFIPLGYNGFKNLILKGHWSSKNIILRHIYKKVFQFHWAVSSALSPKFVKSANMIQKYFLQKCNIGVKKRGIYAAFESVAKVAKNFCEKSYQRKSDRIMEFFTFITFQCLYFTL